MYIIKLKTTGINRTSERKVHSSFTCAVFTIVFFILKKKTLTFIICQEPGTKQSFFYHHQAHYVAWTPGFRSTHPPFDHSFFFSHLNNSHYYIGIDSKVWYSRFSIFFTLQSPSYLTDSSKNLIGHITLSLKICQKNRFCL